MSWFAKKKKIKKQQIGAVQVAPSFTADRFFVYLVGGTATLAGLYVIYTFVKQGLEKGNKKDENASENINNVVNSAVASPSPMNLPAQVFPIRYEGFNPPYRNEVAELQKLLLEVGQSLPVYGVDGRFGPETLTAVQNQFLNRNKTQVERGEIIALKQIADLKKQVGSLQGLGYLGKKKTILMPVTNNNSLMPLGSLGCSCGCNTCNN